MAELRSQSYEEYEPLVNDTQDWYLALCLGGMQAMVKGEVERHLAACGDRAEVHVFNEDCRGARLFGGVHDGQAGCGKLLVATDASPDTLRSIPALQGLFALVTHEASLDIGLPSTREDTARDLPQAAERTITPNLHQQTTDPAPAADPSPSEAALANMESLVTAAPLWPAAVNVWRRFSAAQAQQKRSAPAENAEVVGSLGLSQPAASVRLGEETGGENSSQTVADIDVTRLKFRFSVVRDGQHPFGSVEASPRLGGAVLSVNRGWTVDLKEYDVEVVAFILERSMVVGLALDADRTKRCSHGRIPKEDKRFLESGKRASSLRPSTAYIMLSLAEPTIGDVIVDCMCGIGTIPFLGAGWFSNVFLLGGEVDETATDHLLLNSLSMRQFLAPPAKAAGSADVCAWDAQCLPLRDGSVDTMIVDMPFGQSCGTPRQNARLFPVVMAEMARVLRPGSGRGVLLVAQPHLLGLPGLRRNNQKDRKKLRKNERERMREDGFHARIRGEGAGAVERSERGLLGEQKQSTFIADAADEEHRGPNSEGGVPQQVGPVDSASPSQGIASDAKAEDGGGLGVGAAPGDLWRVRARHAVNVGGLISYLLILERTAEPSPRPRSNRRGHSVGREVYCKHRKGGKQWGC